jgi:hypothetical protein
MQETSMKMKTIAMGFALLVLTTSAMAIDGDRRPSTKTNGAIAWSTRDRDGNKLAIVFQFGERAGINVRYEQGDRYDRYDRDRYDRYDRNDRYGRNDRYDRYDRNGHRYCPPVYDYSRYRGRDFDRRFFADHDEWSDWRQWQKHWSKRKNWQRDDRERARAWSAFCNERDRAYSQWERSHRDRDGRDWRRDRDDD